MIFKFLSKVTNSCCYWPKPHRLVDKLCFLQFYFGYSITNQCLLHVRDRFRFGVVLFNHPVPSRHGTLSTAFVMIKRAKFQVLRTMQECHYTMIRT
jgi:hypothetical protein